MPNKFISNYFIFLFSIFPISIILGSTISLINILLIDLSFLFLIFYIREFSFLKNKAVRYLLLLYFYLLFNSLISIDPTEGIYRNLGFIRIIILFVAVNYFFNQKVFFDKVFFIWLIIFFFVAIDIFLESYTGTNMLGYGELYGRRIVSFFKDEPIVASFINAFYLILIGFLYDKFTTQHKSKILLLSLFFLFAIFLTGERSNTIKAFLGIIFFYTFFREYKFKYKITFIITGLIFFVFIILNSEYLKLRYVTQIKSLLTQNKIYFKLQSSGYQVFKNNKFFGVGNKNYRVETCTKLDKTNTLTNKYICNTHPHQIYIELLSEHGLFGSIFILFIFYKLIFSKIINNLNRINYTQIGSFIYISLIFTPLIPSGAFFNDYAITLFGLNVAIFYGASSEMNIFSINKNKIG
tara:strand:- start:205 stop:1431 length:1227 start_codon:yes stop_codon:yes gene_type:complete